MYITVKVIVQIILFCETTKFCYRIRFENFKSVFKKGLNIIIMKLFKVSDSSSSLLLKDVCLRTVLTENGKPLYATS